ncbi:MAG: putative heme transporter, partial [Baekduia sp.]|nr:putative heme transporter [Baekduia sp.]
LVQQRDAVVERLGDRLLYAAGAAVGRWLFDLLALVTAVTAVGAHPRFSLVLLAYVAAQLLAQIPLTPGGIGVVEAGLTATLVLAGVGGGDAAVATLAYRLVSYWLMLPAGLVAWLLHRRRRALAAVP